MAGKFISEYLHLREFYMLAFRGMLVRAPTWFSQGMINSCHRLLRGLAIPGCSAVGSAYGWGP